MMTLPKNHHWVKFGFKDWLIDGAIRSCDAATRGIYMDLFSLAMASDEIGIIALDDKQICKQLAIKPLQFKRVINHLITMKLCVRSINNELILTKITSDIDRKNTEIAPNRTEMEPNGCRTGKENDSLPPKTKPPIIEQNRIEKKVSNPPYIPPSGEPSKKGSRLPDDWAPDDVDREYAHNLNLDPEKVAEDFCDYWHAKAGAGARKVDWSLTWKTWCRRENEKYQDKQDRLDAYNRPRKSNLERIGEKINRAAEFYGVNDWFENGVPQDLPTKPELKVVGGGKW